MKTKFFLLVLCSIYLVACSHDDAVYEKEESSSSRLTILAVEETGGTQLNGGTYRVTRNSKAIGEYRMENGSIELPNIESGEYIIEEMASPDGFYAKEKSTKAGVNSSNSQVVLNYYYKNNQSIPKSVQVDFYDGTSKKVLGTYQSIRIGEYYWTDKNFSHVIPAGTDFENAFPVTQDLLNKYFDCTFLDKSKFQLEDVNLFNTYYGRYYSRPSIDYMNYYGEMHSSTTGRKLVGWGLPSTTDYQQLFAMSPISNFDNSSAGSLTERDVRFTLGAKEGDNPLAFDIPDPTNGPYKTYWFSRNTTLNTYGFGMMPGGARLNGDGSWTNGLSPNGYWDGKKGDIYHLFYTCYYASFNPSGSIGVVMLHDYMDTRGIDSYHLLNVRWTRRLTDEELGYKLYIDNAETDIKKLGLQDPVPSGYKELVHGYLRGFYVQYILDNPNPQVTVSQLIEASHRVEDVAMR